MSDNTQTNDDENSFFNTLAGQSNEHPTAQVLRQIILDELSMNEAIEKVPDALLPSTLQTKLAQTIQQLTAENTTQSIKPNIKPTPPR
jgi:hypothetical protein